MKAGAAVVGPVKLAEIKQLAPLPVSVVRLAQMVGDPDSTVEDFAAIIEFDQALTANVLRWANSAWSQAQAPIASTRSAIVRLGSDNILKLAIGHHLMAPMSQANHGYDLGENELWQHSVAAALAAENLPSFSSSGIPPAAFSAALMHDLGKLVLGRHLGLGNLKELVHQTVERTQCPYVVAEREILGTDHAEVGGLIAREWKIPDTIVRAIEGHHRPDVDPDPLLDVVHIANVLAKWVTQDAVGETLPPEVGSASAGRLGLNPDLFHAWHAKVAAELVKTEERWQTA